MNVFPWEDMEEALRPWWERGGRVGGRSGDHILQLGVLIGCFCCAVLLLSLT